METTPCSCVRESSVHVFLSCKPRLFPSLAAILSPSQQTVFAVISPRISSPMRLLSAQPTESSPSIAKETTTLSSSSRASWEDPNEVGRRHRTKTRHLLGKLFVRAGLLLDPPGRIRPPSGLRTGQGSYDPWHQPRRTCPDSPGSSLSFSAQENESPPHGSPGPSRQ